MKLFWFSIFVFCSFGICLPVTDTDQDWWKHAVFYQIYPRSYQDSNNDGNGDLAGIASKLDHLADAGVTAVWISPIMKSPQFDAGYDISDYYSIEPMYGSMEDLKKVIEKAHALGIKIIMDFVPNHTSNQHEWFKASENGTEEYKDFYIWVDGTPDKPPNNWISDFKDSAWEWSEKRQQWYYHEFLVAQPDLNYRNPAVRQALHKILIYYMDMGVDGFRFDAVPYLVEDNLLRDEPRSYDPIAKENEPNYLTHIYTKDTDETYNVIYEFRDVIDKYTQEHGGHSRIIMTEAYTTLENTIKYFGTADGSRRGGHFTFNFLFIPLHQNTSNAHDIEEYITNWLGAIPSVYVPNWVIGNHDNRRAASRLEPKNADGFNMLINLLPGIGVTYNGEEIGQEDGEVTYEQRRDTSAKSKDTFEKDSRDFERTPIQWDNSVNAGFNEGHETWLPVSQKYHETNLAAQLSTDGLSHYKIYREILRKRKEDVVALGSTNVWSLSDDVLILKRSLDQSHVVLAFKLGWHNRTEPEEVYIPDVECDTATVALTNVDSSHEIGSTLNPKKFILNPHESLILDIAC
ncbi:hypothetical protein WA026_006127 [Henosepilachna vigintioctopunctata]|uniref:alpha-glucosidase n=1 Tax=Henosepilachna vigintioctopunctata TaxID=420089 RepID=A0AAW1TPP5_9CUCU